VTSKMKPAGSFLEFKNRSRQQRAREYAFCFLRALPAILLLLILGSTSSPLWAKRATELRRQRNPGKTGFERSKLATQSIPEGPRSYVEAGTLNRQTQQEFSQSPAMGEFKGKYGPGWQVLVDERSMTPKSLMGEGVPFSTRSDRTSKLGASWQSKLATTNSVGDLERVARQFLADNQAFLKVDPGALALDTSASGMLEEATGKFRLVFQNYYRGVPVLDSFVSMFISHGNMILYDAEHITPINLSTTPALSPMAAVGRLQASLGLGSSDVLLDHAAELYITLAESPAAQSARAKAARPEGIPAALYLGPSGQGYSPELVYRIQFHIPDDNRSLVALVDANTGQLADLYDQNHYQKGSARGAIYTRGPVSTPGYVNNGGTQAPEYIVPFDLFTVINGNTSVTTNPGGVFDLGGLNPLGFSGSFSGAQTNVREAGSPLCLSPQGPADSSGNIVYAAHSDDGRCSINANSPSPGNGQATHGAQNGWFHDNFAISHAQKFLSGFSPGMSAFFNSNFLVLVNDGCNAFWSSACANAGRQECMDLGSCSIPDGLNNQASEPDTMSHEYGHALDYHTKNAGATGDQGKGEGLADVDAWLNTHRTCLSPGDDFPPLPPATSFKGFPQGDACDAAGFPVEPVALQETGDRDFNVFICHDDGSGACPAGKTGRLESNDQVHACGTTLNLSCTGTLGWECHCEGHLTSGSVIDLYKLLVQRYGTNQAWYMIERFYYLGLPGITNALGSSGANSTYSNFLAVDDDNGNLADGTPNADLIYQAFLAHGTEGNQFPANRANCSTSPGSGSPSAPTTFTATPQQTGGILLQWNTVPGATAYRLYRTAASMPGHNYEIDPIPSSYYGRNGVFFNLINPTSRGSSPNSGNNLFTGTSYLDLEVAPGYEYFYQVQAIAPSGQSTNTECRSTLSPGLVDLVANATAPGASQGTGHQEVPLSVPAGGAATTTTIGSSGPVLAGYGVETTNSGAPPYGTAVFSFSQNNIVVSETGVPASPPTTQTRIFIDFRTGVAAKSDQLNSGTINIDTGFAIVNRGSGTATVNYTLRDINGNTIALGSNTMAAGAHDARFIDQLGQVAPRFVIPPNFAGFGSLDIIGDQPLSVVALRLTTNQRNETLITTTPGADLNAPLSTDSLYFAQFVDGGGYKTSFLFLDASTFTETGTVQFFSDTGTPFSVTLTDGRAGTSIPYNIQPGGYAVMQTSGTSGIVNAGWALITRSSGNTPVIAGVFGFTQGGILVTESGIPSATPTTHARVYVDRSVNAAGTHDTGLAIVNTTQFQSLTYTVNAFQMDGVTPVGSGGAQPTLNGYGHTAKFAEQFISGLPSGFTGVLDISAPAPFAALTLRSLNNTRVPNSDFLLTTFPIADATQVPPNPLIFPQIADGGGFRTQFILLGVNGAASTTLDFFGDSGAPIAVGKQAR